MSGAMNLRNISYMLAALLPLSSCSDDKSESTGSASTGAATESGSETSDAGTTTQTNPTTGATGTDGGSNSDSNSGTTTGPGETSDATTADATTADGTTTGVTPDTTTDTTTGGDSGIPEACAGACETIVKCDPNGPAPGECAAACIEDSTPAPDASQECVDATVAFIKCIGAATCDDLNNPDFCAKEADAQMMLCGGGGTCEQIGGAGMGMCSFGEICPDYKHEIVCGKMGCRCFEDDVNVKMCPAMDICAQGEDVLAAFSLECCGW